MSTSTYPQKPLLLAMFRRVEFFRWATLGGLLVFELMILTIRFDAQSVVGAGWVGNLAQIGRNLPQVALAALVVFLIARGNGSDQGNESSVLEKDRGPFAVIRPWIIQLSCFGALFLLTIQFLERGKGSPIWASLWALAGASTVVTAIAIAFPFRQWGHLFRVWGPSAVVASLVGLGAWGFGRLTPLLWEPLGGTTLRFVSFLLHRIYADAMVVPAEQLVGTDRFSVWIAPECSGYEGIGLVLIFLTAFLWISRRSLRFPQAFLLLPLGIAAIWLTNSLRIAVLVAVGTSVSSEVAMGGFHSQAGWLAFNAVGLGLVLLARRSTFFSQIEPAGLMVEAIHETRALSGEGQATTAAYLAPMLSVVLAGMIGAALSSGFDRFYPIRVFAAVGALLYFRREGALSWRVDWSWSWASLGFGVAAFAVWMALEPTPGPSSTIDDGLAGMTRVAAWSWLAFRVFGSVVTVPIVEELAFRGYLPRRLTTSDFSSIPLGRFTAGPLLASSAVFGLMHGRMIAGTAAGLIYALALRRRGRLGDAIFAHATTNALIAALAIARGQTSLWS